MTNAKKYLKDETTYHELACEIALYVSNSLKSGLVQNIHDFFKQQTRLPILTENEEVILKSIKNYQEYFIGREKGSLYISSISHWADDNWCEWYNHLFQFIKDGEEYLITDLLKENDKNE